MRAFFVFHDRYFQACLGESDFLQFVEVFRLLARAFMENLIGEGKETAGRTDFLGIRSGREFLARLHLRGNVFSQLININTGQIELPDFFLERHPAHEVIDSLLDRAVSNRGRSAFGPRLARGSPRLTPAPHQTPTTNHQKVFFPITFNLPKMTNTFTTAVFQLAAVPRGPSL